MTRPRTQFTGEVALGMAHEVGNLLAALELRLQILQQSAECRAAQGRNLDAMARILEEANDLLQRAQALALETPPAGAVPDGPGLVNVQRALAEAIQLAGSGLRLRARRAGVRLRIEQMLDGLPDVPGAPAAIRQTLVGLLIGAGRSLPEGGTIRVVGRRAAGAVVLRFEDGRGARLNGRSGRTGAPLELRLPYVARKRTRSRSAASQDGGD